MEKDGIMCRAAVEKEVVYAAVDIRWRDIGEVLLWCLTPEVEAVISSEVEIFKNVFNVMIVYFVWA